MIPNSEDMLKGTLLAKFHCGTNYLVNSEGCDRRTALSYAAANGHQKVVGVLLQHNADATAKDEHGRTVLHEAAQKGSKDIIEMLLRQNADAAAKDDCGYTAFHHAARRHREGIRELLLQYSVGGAVKDKIPEQVRPLVRMMLIESPHR